MFIRIKKYKRADCNSVQLILLIIFIISFIVIQIETNNLAFTKNGAIVFGLNKTNNVIGNFFLICFYLLNGHINNFL